MEGLVFAGISLILLVPVLFILPLGLSAKGKLAVAGVAVLLAAAGSAGMGMIPLWQIGLLLVLLAGMAAYIFDQKLSRAMYQEVQGLADVKTHKKVISSKKTEQSIPMESVPAVHEKILEKSKHDPIAEDINPNAHSAEGAEVIPTDESPSYTEKNTDFFDDVLSPIEFLSEPSASNLSDEEKSVSSNEVELDLIDFNEIEIAVPDLEDPVIENRFDDEEDYIHAFLEVAAAVSEEERALAPSGNSVNG